MTTQGRVVTRPDGRLRYVGRLICGIGLAAASIGALEAAAGWAFGEPRAILLGLAAILYGAWIIRLTRSLESLGAERIVTRTASLSLAVIGAGAILQPTMSTAMAVASVVPAVMVLPFLGSRGVGRILVAAGVVGIGSVLAGAVVPVSRQLPTALNHAVASASIVLAFGFLLLFLWEVSGRMKSTADDLRSVVAMSSDISQTMDPQVVGDRIARHIARAVGATDCALSYWDRLGDRLVTLGYFPLDRRGALEPTYSLADYPMTRRILEQQQPAIIDIDDRLSDPAEIAYLRSIGHRSMVIVPLVAAGTTTGTIELTSERSGAFDDRQVEIAMFFAGEAAMALENARLYEEISHQALHDGLTGLPNRVLFRDRVGHALTRSRGRDGRGFAVLFIDLDDFNTLNDTLGHARGDEVLIAAAQRVTASLRPSDTAARLGGDEFAVLLDDCADEELALSIAIRLADALREPMDLGAITPAVAASIGVAVSGAEGETADDLLRNADVAMYAAKASSRGRAELFRSAMRDRAAVRIELAGILRGAEKRGELRLDYQPIVELIGGGVVGLEALVRWQPPDRPLLMPMEFIDLAEETGDIVPMGRWILGEACRQTREWQVRLGLPHLQVSVNLSARQFQEQDLVECVRSVLDESGLPATSLILEITESGLMQRTSGTISRLGELRDLGAHLAIDDFGTGYSSLSYLERFPVDILKIDRSFIASMSERGERSAIARAIVELGRSLGLRVVAEGIERADQADWLLSLGCPLGQGYLFSRPLGVDATEAFLATDATRRAQVPVVPKPVRRSRRGPPKLRLVSGE